MSVVDAVFRRAGSVPTGVAQRRPRKPCRQAREVEGEEVPELDEYESLIKQLSDENEELRRQLHLSETALRERERELAELKQQLARPALDDPPEPPLLPLENMLHQAEVRRGLSPSRAYGKGGR